MNEQMILRILSYAPFYLSFALAAFGLYAAWVMEREKRSKRTSRTSARR